MALGWCLVDTVGSCIRVNDGGLGLGLGVRGMRVLGCVLKHRFLGHLFPRHPRPFLLVFFLLHASHHILQSACCFLFAFFFFSLSLLLFALPPSSLGLRLFWCFWLPEVQTRTHLRSLPPPQTIPRWRPFRLPHLNLIAISSSMSRLLVMNTEFMSLRIRPK